MTSCCRIPERSKGVTEKTGPSEFSFASSTRYFSDAGVSEGVLKANPGKWQSSSVL